jgi:hypothetical protein
MQKQINRTYKLEQDLEKNGGNEAEIDDTEIQKFINRLDIQRKLLEDLVAGKQPKTGTENIKKEKK